MQAAREADGALPPKWHEVGQTFGKGGLRAVGLMAKEATHLENHKHRRLADRQVTRRTDGATMDAVRGVMAARATGGWSNGMSVNTEFTIDRRTASIVHPGRDIGKIETDIAWEQHLNNENKRIS